MSRIFGALGASALFILLSGQPGTAQWRDVYVNGQKLGPAELAEADRAAGLVLPDGDYWYNAGTCTWGVEGDPRPVGQVPCQRRQPQQKPSYLFTPPTCDSQGCFIGHDY
jgi:hypothetical protein